MFVSHLSYFLFYLHVSASVQRKNCLARDKSFLAIPTVPWFNRKKWFMLWHATKHCHNLAATVEMPLYRPTRGIAPRADALD